MTRWEFEKLKLELFLQFSFAPIVFWLRSLVLAKVPSSHSFMCGPCFHLFGIVFNCTFGTREGASSSGRNSFTLFSPGSLKTVPVILSEM